MIVTIIAALVALVIGGAAGYFMVMLFLRISELAKMAFYFPVINFSQWCLMLRKS